MHVYYNIDAIRLMNRSNSIGWKISEIFPIGKQLSMITRSNLFQQTQVAVSYLFRCHSDDYRYIISTIILTKINVYLSFMITSNAEFDENLICLDHICYGPFYSTDFLEYISKVVHL